MMISVGFGCAAAPQDWARPGAECAEAGTDVMAEPRVCAEGYGLARAEIRARCGKVLSSVSPGAALQVETRVKLALTFSSRRRAAPGRYATQRPPPIAGGRRN
jgi:hypothetical protein